MSVGDILWPLFLVGVSVWPVPPAAAVQPGETDASSATPAGEDDSPDEPDVPLSAIPRPIHDIDPALLSQRAPASFRVAFETSAGSFVVKVNRTWSPLGADRFYNLVQAGFYAGIRVHRIIKDSFIQFGIHGQPAVNRAFFTAAIPDDVRQQTNNRGMVAFASTRQNARRTELIVSLKNNAWLDKQGIVPFGEVISGLNVLQALPPVPAAGQASPVRRWMLTRGNSYLARDYPGLPVIVSASVVP